MLGLNQGHNAEPSAAIIDGRMLQLTPESGGRAGRDRHKGKKWSKVHLAVHTLGRFLALYVSPANDQAGAQVAELAQVIQEGTEAKGGVAFVD